MRKITASSISTLAAPAKYLNGKAWVNDFSTGAGCDIASVTFEPGARTHWHLHHNFVYYTGVTPGKFVTS